MWWVVLFGGIVVFALVLYAALGLWVWHRVRDLTAELQRSAVRAERVLAGEDPARARSAVGSTGTGGAHRG